MRSLLVLVAAISFSSAAPERTSAQAVPVEGTVRGRIVEVASDEGIPAVQVDYLDPRGRVRASATSDDEGSFLLARVPAGSFRLRAARIGYVTAATEYGRVEPGEVLTVVVRLQPEAIPLAPLEITARDRSTHPVLEGFHFRRLRGVGGTFLGREEIERRSAQRITDLLQTVPGIRVASGPGPGSRRLVSMVPPGAGGSDGRCPVQVFVDGVLAARRTFLPPGGGLSGVDGVPVDDLATPGELEGVEIYRGLGSVPPEFLTPDAECGVIALWTRRDP
jgi:hypothetical protein